MANDVVTNKVSIIERCINRVQEVYDHDPENLKDMTKQDSVILNIQKACESIIDLAMHVAAQKQLGLPQTSRDVFDLLKDAGVIEQSVAKQMKAMVGFRNIAVHDYQNIDNDILQHIITEHIDDFHTFTQQVIHDIMRE